MVCIHVKKSDDAEGLMCLKQKFDDASIDVRFDSGSFNFLCETSDAEEVMSILHEGGYLPSVD